MKKQYTVKELWAFVNRANTHEKISIAENFLKKLEYLDNEVWNEMMEALAFKSRELYHRGPN